MKEQTATHVYKRARATPPTYPRSRYDLDEDDDSLCAASVIVKNLTSFANGQDERDYLVVNKTDIDTAAATLKAKVQNGMAAAFHGQLTPTEQLHSLPCPPATSADHGVGDEATHVQVTVSETCTAIAYNPQAVTDQATRLLTAQATKQFGQGYMLYGTVKVSNIEATTPPTPPALLSFTCQGTYVYSLDGQAQQRLKHFIAGKPRTTALRLLAHVSGIQRASISGIAGNEQLPIDASHIHLLIVVTVF